MKPLDEYCHTCGGVHDEFMLKRCPESADERLAHDMNEAYRKGYWLGYHQAVAEAAFSPRSMMQKF